MIRESALEFQHRLEPFSNEELKKLGRPDLMTHEEVEETTSSFQEGVTQIIIDGYRQTVSE